MSRISGTRRNLRAIGVGAGVAWLVLGAAAASAAPATIARATAIPNCTLFVDASVTADGIGSVAKPHKTITAAAAAAPEGAVICVAEGVYPEEISPGEKGFTLAGGFQRGKAFKVRDSAAYVSKAQGKGAGSFVRIAGEGPKEKQLNAIDGFEITGHSQAIFRDVYYSQRFDITNNYIHDNVCSAETLVGAGFWLNNVSGTIRGNVIRKNLCGRGGGGGLNDDNNKNTVRIEDNLVEANAGTEPTASHGGGLNLGANTIVVSGNAFVGNTVTKWGAGLYVNAYPEGDQPTTATMSRNVYRDNRAGFAGGGFFCDGGAKCISSNELYDRNCGGNIYVDSGSETSGPTVASFDRITNVGALGVGCEGPGVGMRIDVELAQSSDRYAVTNSIFCGNAEGRDFTTGCNEACTLPEVAVSNSMAQTRFLNNGLAIAFGAGMIAPSDPMFVAPDRGDFRLQAGSPAAGKGAYGPGYAPPASVTLPIAQTVDVPQDMQSAGGATAIAESPAAATVKAPAERSAEPPALSDAPAPDGAPAATMTAGSSDLTAKEAFEEAKDLGTVEGWTVFLKTYPTGFHADLARAYLNKLAGATGAPAEPAPAPKGASAPAASTLGAPPPSAAPATVAPRGASATTIPAARKPAVTRGVKYFGFPEKFNRYYTDPAWMPARTVYVSPAGGGDGATRDTPTAVEDAVAAAQPGTKIHFVRGAYQGCFEFGKENGGTYDAPVMLYAEREADSSIGVKMTCCATGRQTCFNMEQADYVAVDGFELIGGRYGVRAVGEGYPASQHSRGVAALNCVGHDQENDPFFTGQSDWFVLDGTVSYGAKSGDGHGIYISNGSDWNVVRNNETYDNTRADFQINADPNSTCKDVGIAFDDPRCDAYAGIGEGGQGVSDYFLVENNYFHHGRTNGPNFTSVRRSVVRNNIFGPQGRHNVTFWQETDNPKLGSSENRILHNLFLTTGRHGVKFEANSTRNEFANNVLIGVTLEGGMAVANPSALLMEVDDTVGANRYRGNLYVSGKLEGRTPGAEETARPDFDPAWFANFPIGMSHDPNGFRPAETAPFLDIGARSPDAAVDLNGLARGAKADPGPIELP